jgi:type II secretory pathway component PulF
VPVFEYIHQDHEGRRVKGTLEAESKTAAVLELRDRGILTTEVHPIGPSAAERAKAERHMPGAFRRYFIDPIFFRVGYRKLAWLFTQLASATRSGVSLVEALDMVSKDLRPARLREAIRTIHDQVMRGQPMSEAMKQYPTIFNELMVALVAAGERSGNLPEMFTAIADWLEYEVSIRTKMFTATLYPKLVAIAAMGIIAVILNAQLAASGQFGLLALSCPATILGLITLWFLYKGGERFMEQFEPWRRAWDAIKVQTPIIGGMFRKFALARFCTILGTLYQAGLLLPTSTEIAADACGNAYIRDKIKQAVPVLNQGNGLADTLRQTQVFPANVLHMMATGEQTGDLDSLMENVAKHMTEEADATAQRMVPVIFVAMLLLVLLCGAGFIISWYASFFGGYASDLGL